MATARRQARRAARYRGPQARSVPGGFEPVAQVLLVWDPDHESYLVAILSALCNAAEIVVVVKSDDAIEEACRAMLRCGIDPLGMTFLVQPLTSMWVRDYGPLVVRGHRQREVVELIYHGGFPDDCLPRHAASVLWPELRVSTLPIVLDGGNLLSNGRGTYIVSEQVLLDNDEGTFHRALRRQLGCKQLIILEPLEGEPTSHVDMFVSLASPRDAIVGRYEPGRDAKNARILDRAAQRLELEGFRVHRVPMPGNADGRFRTYLNLVAVNDVVLVPVYLDDREHRREALETIQRCFSRRRVIPIECSELIALDGALHCSVLSVAA